VTGQTGNTRAVGERSRRFHDFLYLAGCRYWTASLLPAIVGTTLPFWLRPPGFSFRWPAAVEFLAATMLVHAGFSFLHARFDARLTVAWPGSRLLGLAGACIVAGSLLGLHVNSGLTLHDGVPRSIFVVYGTCGLFGGVLYVVPPFSFCRRAGGETVICGALGLVPVLGAYLVQVGDLTRTVYLASAPVVVATALWVWTDELITRASDEMEGRRTMVVLFGPRFSGRFVVPALSLLFYATLFLAVSSSSIAPWALAVLLTIGLMPAIVAASWHEYDGSTRLHAARSNAFVVHLVTGIVIAASSLVARGT
jgi:1,4-dihydroxy-2-naphthoate octaprenyltransferase